MGEAWLGVATLELGRVLLAGKETGIAEITDGVISVTTLFTFEESGSRGDAANHSSSSQGNGEFPPSRFGML